MGRASRVEYEDWVSNPITQTLFDFFKLEAELIRRGLAAGSLPNGSFTEVGESYVKELNKAQIYEQLEDIQYEDLYPEEELVDEVSEDDSPSGA